jgi:hypothetical protein
MRRSRITGYVLFWLKGRGSINVGQMDQTSNKTRQTMSRRTKDDTRYWNTRVVLNIFAGLVT